MSGGLKSTSVFCRQGGRLKKEILQDYFIQLQSHFLKGELPKLETFFSYPLVVYTAVGIVIVRNETQHARLTEKYRAALVEMEVTDSVVELQSYDWLDQDRLRATVAFEDLNAERQVVTESVVRYFLVQNSGRFQIEMVEYLKSPLPENTVSRIIH